MVFLDFEKTIEDLYAELDKLQEIQAKGKTDVSKPIEDLEKEIKKERKALYSNLSAWQKVQVSRHPERPYTLSYIEAVTKGNFIELHGDRNVKDDKAMVGGIGEVDGQSVMFIGQQKGVNTKMRLFISTT